MCYLPSKLAFLDAIYLPAVTGHLRTLSNECVMCMGKLETYVHAAITLLKVFQLNINSIQYKM